jgi:glycosyltransferase involved in cell wall biosynthesis
MSTGTRRPAAARPWRIALVTTFYPPYNFGGDGIAVRHLAAGLARRGHDVTVVHDTDGYRTLAGEPGAEARAAAEAAAPAGVRVVPIRSSLPLLSTLVTQQTGHPGLKRAALRRALAGRFDVIHFHNVSLVGGPGALGIGDAAVRLYTAHEHWLVCPTHVLWRDGREPCDERACVGCVVRQGRPPQLWRATGLLERELARVDVVFAQSEFSRDRHRAYGLAHEMQVLPPFLADAPPAPPRTRAEDARPYVLFVGRLEPMKGLADVIPHFAQPAFAAGADLVIAGEGPQRAELERLAAGNPRVRFLGRLDADTLVGVYRGARAVVVPTLGYETFGLVVIEAFRHGRPVVARKRGPLPELVEQGDGAGLLFSTAAELDAALTRLVRDPAHGDAIGRRGAAAVDARWSEHAVLPRYEAIVAAAALAKGAVLGGTAAGPAASEAPRRAREATACA